MRKLFKVDSERLGLVSAAKQLAIVIINHKKADGEKITFDVIKDAATSALSVLSNSPEGREVLLDSVIAVLEQDINIHVGDFEVLEDNSDHKDWSEEIEGIDWKFWSRYQSYLSNENLPGAVIDGVSKATLNILSRLESPNRPGDWDRRGLVVGQVQSGKTSNYIGLACRAIDAGYKLVVILAGVDNSLRSQTQARVDEGILGFDSRKALQFDQAFADKRIGVGLLATNFLHINSFTSSLENGDFKTAVAEAIGVAPGGTPIILVVKKNTRILENLVSWATGIAGEFDPNSNKMVVGGVPLLVIDDESDHASVDTRGNKPNSKSETDPTRINGLIRDLLNRFRQSAYVGYTATPFANMFIRANVEHSVFGEDIFPRSFILQLPTPSNYIGAAKVFGLRGDDYVGIEEQEGLPIVFDVNDYMNWIPDNHRKSFSVSSEIPESLKTAMIDFIIANSIRTFRGDKNKHRTMLIHVTRFVDVQNQIADIVRQIFKEIENDLNFAFSDSPWGALFESRYEAACLINNQLSLDPEMSDQVGGMPTFAEAVSYAKLELKLFTVIAFNGKSDDALQYVDNDEGSRVVAIGGAKLSRGLTLEGLCVSYYLRTSKMYDTLMQMGRWFGYRPRYLDACRLFTTPDLQIAYELIASASEELSEDFRTMEITGSTPEDFGMKVRHHPGGLLVTAPNKLRSARSFRLSYSSDEAETLKFTLSDLVQKQQLEKLNTFVDVLGEQGVQSSPNDNILWKNVDSETIILFLNGFISHPETLRAQPKALIDYVRSRASDGELLDWTVVLVGKKEANKSQSFGNFTIGLSERRTGRVVKNDFSLKRLADPRHSLTLLNTYPESYRNQLDRQIVETEGAPVPVEELDKRISALKKPSLERKIRNPNLGLLVIYTFEGSIVTSEKGNLAKTYSQVNGDCPLIGFTLSFPASERAKPIEYQVTEQYWKSIQAGINTDQDDDDDDE